MRLLYLFLLLSLSATVNGQRITGSPYPFSLRPDTIFLVNDQNFADAQGSQLLVIETLQGLVAKEGHGIYRISGKASQALFNDLAKLDNIPVDFHYVKSLPKLLRHFNGSVKGYILCDLHQPSANAAISLCSQLKAVAVTSEDTAMLKEAGLAMLLDLRGKKPENIYRQHPAQFNHKILCYQKETKDEYLGDYTVFSGALQFFGPVKSQFIKSIFKKQEKNAAVLGWGDDEPKTVALISKNGGFLHAADFSNNLSVLTNINTETKQYPSPDTLVNPDSVHTVCFLATDGDNIQWDMNGLMTDEKLFANSHRGQFSMGWTLTPALCELAPTALRYFYQHASHTPGARDCFVAGPSGIGYMNPDNFPALETYAPLLDSFMRKADMRIVNVIGIKYSKEAIAPFLRQADIDAVFYYLYADYSGLHGHIDWVNGKPVIGGRFNLWKGFEPALSLAEKLNECSRDKHSENGYSLVPVNVWSNGLNEVAACIARLDTHVRVVSPDEFVRLIVKNVKGPQTTDHSPH